MKLYESIIKEADLLVGKFNSTRLDINSTYPEGNEKTFLFASDTALTLGSSLVPSPYLMCYEQGIDHSLEDEILLIGNDIKDLKSHLSYAHISFVFLKECEKKEQELYRTIRNVEYTRYKINPDGVMLKFHTGLLKESIRISYDALQRGISFKDIGKLFLDHYKSQNEVKSVKQIFITDPAFDYKTLESLSKKSEGITVALDHIMKNLKMDCSTCSFKEICDTVDGMKELHQKESIK